MELHQLKYEQLQVSLAITKSSAELQRAQTEFKQKQEQAKVADLVVQRISQQMDKLRTVETTHLVPELHQNVIRHAVALNASLTAAKKESSVRQTAFAAVQSRVQQYTLQQQVFNGVKQQLKNQELNKINDFHDQLMMDLASGGKRDSK